MLKFNNKDLDFSCFALALDLPKIQFLGVFCFRQRRVIGKNPTIVEVKSVVEGKSIVDCSNTNYLQCSDYEPKISTEV